MAHNESDEFLKEAEAGRSNLFTEFWDFLKYNKKWWLLPIVIGLLLIGFLAVFAASGAAPFIYTLF